MKNYLREIKRSIRSNTKAEDTVMLLEVDGTSGYQHTSPTPKKQRRNIRHGNVFVGSALIDCQVSSYALSVSRCRPMLGVVAL
ncbi:MAG: hypothetical protein AB8U44_02505 [Aaplasma endosymbiont of Hyalomma asiaticum]